MSSGNIAFLGLEIGSFTTFAVVLSWASAIFTRWRDGPAGIPDADIAPVPHMAE